MAVVYGISTISHVHAQLSQFRLGDMLRHRPCRLDRWSYRRLERNASALVSHTHPTQGTSASAEWYEGDKRKLYVGVRGWQWLSSFSLHTRPTTVILFNPVHWPASPAASPARFTRLVVLSYNPDTQHDVQI